MSYFSYRVRGPRDVFDYNAFNVRLIRQESEKPEVPIHLIGGIAGDTSRRQTRAYVRAVRTFGTPGGSYYAFDSTRSEHWRELRKIPVNPRPSPPLPIPLGATGWTEPIGNVLGEDRSHPKEVFFRVGPRSKPLVLQFEAFDVTPGEVDLQVNWRSFDEVASTPEREWGAPQRVRIPAWRFDEDRSSFISFVARGDYPKWSIWGVRNVVGSAP
jgi:hypothetical protein